MITESARICDLSTESFVRFAEFITSELGIQMPESKLSLIQSRLLRRVRELKLSSLEEYTEYFFSANNAEERDHFINAITTNKTDFFREPQHFQYLTSTALPSLAEKGAGRPSSRLKVWCAGCSTGEEPYTMAMVLREYAEKRPPFEFAILGTDVSTRVLTHAKTAIYSQAQIEPVPPELRRKYLLQSRAKSEQLVRIVPELRRTVTFHRLNFMDDDYGVRDVFDVIFFRNVLIYFDKQTQEQVVNKLCRHLAPGGYFFAGHSECLSGLDIPMKAVSVSIFRKPMSSL